MFGRLTPRWGSARSPPAGIPRGGTAGAPPPCLRPAPPGSAARGRSHRRWPGSDGTLVRYSSSTAMKPRASRATPAFSRPEVVEHRPPARGVEHAVGLQFAAIAQGGAQAAVGLALNALDVAVELQVQALLAQLLFQVAAHRVVEAAQEAARRGTAARSARRDPGRSRRIRRRCNRRRPPVRGAAAAAGGTPRWS